MGFGKKRIEELEKQLEKLNKEFEELKKERDQLKGYESSAHLNILALKEDVKKLESQNKESHGTNRELIAKLNEAKHELSMAVRERDKALAELEKIRKAEEKSEKLAQELLITESNLASLIKKVKLLTALVIRTLERFMDKYSFLRYHLTSYKMSTEESELRKKQFFPNFGNYSREQIEEAKKRGVDLNINMSGDEPLQQGMVALLRIYKLLGDLEGLVAKELMETQALKNSDLFVEKAILQKYKDIYEKYTKFTIDFFFEETALGALKKDTLEEHHIETLNKTMMDIVHQIIVLVKKARENLLSKAIGIFFPEFDKIQIDLEKKLNELFRLVVKEINKNVLLVQRLCDLEDKEIAEAQKQFEIYLKTTSESYGRAVHKSAKRR